MAATALTKGQGRVKEEAMEEERATRVTKEAKEDTRVIRGTGA